MQLTAITSFLSCGNGLTSKMVRVMKITAVLLLAACLHASARTDGQAVTLKVKNAPLKEVFRAIQQQTGLDVLVDEALLQKAGRVTLDVRDMPVPQVLNICLKNEPLTYTIVDGRIVVKPAPTVVFQPTVTTPPLPPPPITIKVFDEEGAPLAGATVSIKKSKNTGVTDAEGVVTLNVSNGSVLSISFVGFETQSVTISSQNSSISIVLKRSTSAMEEVLLNKGYYTEKQRLSTGNVSKVTAKDIERQPVSNPLAALEGRVPGMIVTQTTGVPGGAFKIEIRGRTAIDRTITDDQPLFVIDGVPYAPNNGYFNTQLSAIGNPTNSSSATSPGGISPFSNINPLDIESIEVLKDADATSIYGSRGANGVVLITTKKGIAGKTRLTFSTNNGISNVTRRVQMMNTREYLNLRRIAFKNDGVTPNLTNAFDFKIWDTTRYTDMNKLLTEQTAHNNSAQLNLSGGNNQTQFMIMGSFNRETTVSPGDLANRRITVGFNMSHVTVDQKFKVTLSTNYGSGKNNQIYNDLSVSTKIAPNFRIYDEQGKLAWNEGGITSYINPLAYLNRTYEAKSSNLVSNLQFSYKLGQYLQVRTSAGFNTTNINETGLNPETAQNPASQTNRSSAFDRGTFNSWIIEPQVEYKRPLAGGQVTALIGASWQDTRNENANISGNGYSSDELMRSTTGAVTIAASTSSSQYRYQAGFARINYNYFDRYLVNLSARRDGSSRFGPGKRFANFGAIGAAWIFSNEALFKAWHFLSFGKLRASYGTTGNDKITDYQFLDTWITTTTYNGAPSLYPNKLFNPDYHWEGTSKAELALELGFFQDRISTSVAYYNNRSSNQLVQYRLPRTTGFANVIANFPALVENAGLEFTVTSTNIQKAGFSWSTSANITVPKNRLLSFPGLSTSPYAYNYVIKQSLNVINRYKYTGVDPQTGYFTFEDVNKDGVYTIADNQPLGSVDPDFYGGLQNDFRVKNIRVSFFFSFRKQLGRNYVASYSSSNRLGGQNINWPAATRFWQNPGDEGVLQKPTQGGSSKANTNWSIFLNGSNGIYSDASFIRMKNAQVSYDLPEQWLRSHHIERLNVFLQGQNLFTITRYEVGDPETQSLLRLPPLRTFTVGLQITL